MRVFIAEIYAFFSISKKHKCHCDWRNSRRFGQCDKAEVATPVVPIPTKSLLGHRTNLRFTRKMQQLSKLTRKQTSRLSWLLLTPESSVQSLRRSVSEPFRTDSHSAKQTALPYPQDQLQNHLQNSETIHGISRFVLPHKSRLPVYRIGSPP